MSSRFFVLEDGLLRSNSATSKITADVNSPHCSVDTPPFVPASSKQMPQGLFGSAISIREGCLVQQSAEAAFESGSQQALWCDNQPRLRLSQVSNKLCGLELLSSRGRQGNTICLPLLFVMSTGLLIPLRELFLRQAFQRHVSLK